MFAVPLSSHVLFPWYFHVIPLVTHGTFVLLFKHMLTGTRLSYLIVKLYILRAGSPSGIKVSTSP